MMVPDEAWAPRFLSSLSRAKLSILYFRFVEFRLKLCEFDALSSRFSFELQLSSHVFTHALTSQSYRSSQPYRTLIHNASSSKVKEDGKSLLFSRPSRDIWSRTSSCIVYILVHHPFIIMDYPLENQNNSLHIHGSQYGLLHWSSNSDGHGYFERCRDLRRNSTRARCLSVFPPSVGMEIVNRLQGELGS